MHRNRNAPSRLKPDPEANYERLQMVGKGSFGQVFLVRNRKTGERLVMKSISLIGMGRSEKIEALQEAHVLQKLDHPNCIRYVESFETSTTLKIVTEYAAKGDLHQFIQARRGKRLPEKLILDWFLQICLAVKYLHQRHILHRDIKTSNIFISDKNLIKLGDFGISKVLAHTMQCANTAVGTPYYMSPEICQNKPYNNRSDVWAMGCVLYELTTLKHAFTANSMKALIGEILKSRYKPIPSCYSCELSDLISSMLQRDPMKRPSLGAILQLPIMKDRIQAFLEGRASTNKPHQSRPLRHSPVPSPPRKDDLGDNPGHKAKIPRLPPIAALVRQDLNKNRESEQARDREREKERRAQNPVQAPKHLNVDEAVARAQSRIAAVRRAKRNPQLPSPPRRLPALPQSPPQQRFQGPREERPFLPAIDHKHRMPPSPPLPSPKEATLPAYLPAPSAPYAHEGCSEGDERAKNVFDTFEEEEEEEARREAGVGMDEEAELDATEKSLFVTMKQALKHSDDDEAIFVEKNGSVVPQFPPGTDPLHKFKLNGGTYALPSVSAGDSLSYRVEMLQVHLEELLGSSRFLLAHQILQSVTSEEAGEAALVSVKGLLGEQRSAYIPLIMQLIFCEDLLNESN